jgi:hypothetical protein
MMCVTVGAFYLYILVTLLYMYVDVPSGIYAKCCDHQFSWQSPCPYHHAIGSVPVPVPDTLVPPAKRSFLSRRAAHPL